MRTLRDFCIGCVKVYRLTLAPLFMSFGVQCRFNPTCSEYTIQAIKTHGALLGCFLGLGRILRCHPFCRGGHDPVPERLRFLEWKNG